MYFEPSRIIGWALAILVAGLAINYAARLLLAVWPVLAVAGGLIAAGMLLGRWLWSRNSGW